MAEVAAISEATAGVKPALVTSKETQLTPEQSLVDSQLARMREMSQQKQKIREESGFAHAGKVLQETGSVASAFSAVVGNVTQADNISCCYNMAGSHVAEERLLAGQLDRNDLTADQQLIFSYIKNEVAQLRTSRELMGEVIMADALSDVRINNGTLPPDSIDDGEYIFGHPESDAYVDDQVLSHALEVMTRVEQAIPEWQSIAANQEQVHAAFTPEDIQLYLEQTTFPLRVGRKAISDQDIFRRYREKLLQAQKEGNKAMFKQTMQAFVIRSTLLQSYIEELHYNANLSLLKKLEEGSGTLSPEQEVLMQGLAKKGKVTKGAA